MNLQPFKLKEAKVSSGGKKLGAGASADVVLGEFEETGVPVAIKIMKNALDFDSRREIKALKLLRPHRNVVKFYCDDQVHIGNATFDCLCLELCGRNFEHFLLERSIAIGKNFYDPAVLKNNTNTMLTCSLAIQMSEDECRPYFLDMIQAVAYLHSNNMTHRDIKPENFLISLDEGYRATLKISDFGLSRLHDDASFNDTIFAGSHFYVAPEYDETYQKKVKKSKYTTEEGKRLFEMKSDLWSLGIVFHRVLFGVRSIGLLRTIQWEGRAAFSQQFDVDRTNGLISASCRDLLVKMLCDDPDARISSSECLMHDFHCGPWTTCPEKASEPVPVKAPAPSVLILYSAPHSPVEIDLTKSQNDFVVLERSAGPDELIQSLQARLEIAKDLLKVDLLKL